MVSPAGNQAREVPASEEDSDSDCVMLEEPVSWLSANKKAKTSADLAGGQLKDEGRLKDIWPARHNLSTQRLQRSSSPLPQLPCSIAGRLKVKSAAGNGSGGRTGLKLEEAGPRQSQMQGKPSTAPAESSKKRKDFIRSLSQSGGEQRKAEIQSEAQKIVEHQNSVQKELESQGGGQRKAENQSRVQKGVDLQGGGWDKVESQIRTLEGIESQGENRIKLDLVGKRVSPCNPANQFTSARHENGGGALAFRPALQQDERKKLDPQSTQGSEGDVLASQSLSPCESNSARKLEQAQSVLVRTAGGNRNSAEDELQQNAATREPVTKLPNDEGETSQSKLENGHALCREAGKVQQTGGQPSQARPMSDCSRPARKPRTNEPASKEGEAAHAAPSQSVRGESMGKTFSGMGNRPGLPRQAMSFTPYPSNGYTSLLRKPGKTRPPGTLPHVFLRKKEIRSVSRQAGEELRQKELSAPAEEKTGTANGGVQLLESARESADRTATFRVLHETENTGVKPERDGVASQRSASWSAVVPNSSAASKEATTEDAKSRLHSHEETKVQTPWSLQRAQDMGGNVNQSKQGITGQTAAKNPGEQRRSIGGKREGGPALQSGVRKVGERQQQQGKDNAGKEFYCAKPHSSATEACPAGASPDPMDTANGNRSSTPGIHGTHSPSPDDPHTTGSEKKRTKLADKDSPDRDKAFTNGGRPAPEKKKTVGYLPIPDDIPSMKPGFLVSRDVSGGWERIPISCVHEEGDNGVYGLPEEFKYRIQSLELNEARVNRCLDRFGENFCTCRGNCLDGIMPCSCSQTTGGVYGYDCDGLLIERLATPYHAPDREIGQFITECSPKCSCAKNCGNRVVQRGIKFKFQIFMTKHKGWGIRTLEKIPARSFLFEYVGEITTNEEQLLRNERYMEEGEHAYQMQLDADGRIERVFFKGGLSDDSLLVLDATKFGNLSRFMNHRCEDANVFYRPVQIDTHDTHYYHVAFFAARDIERMEEITWDYGEQFDAADDKDDNTAKGFKCKCGSPFCRDQGAGTG